MRSVIVWRFAFFGLLALYPFVVYFGLRVLPPSFFGILLAIVVAARFAVLKRSDRTLALPILVLLLIYAIVAAFLGRAEALLYYPVLVNLLLCTIFVGSLGRGEPLLLRIVRARGIPISKHGPRYLTNLTAAWAAFFMVNGLVALWTTTLSMETWTLYNGLISYLLVGLFLSVEWLFRRHYKRKLGVSNP
ncbi:MAG TPA: hypothetical protein VMR74_01330 [Gammaproteobacteria bacterium]|nr:hypothetical protein [Gammaproteobacteria bacterium]